MTEVPGREEVDRAVRPVDDRAWIPAGVPAVIPDDLEVAPGVASVAASPENQVDVAGIAASFESSFRECQECSIGGFDEGRDSERVVAVLAGGEDRVVADVRARALSFSLRGSNVESADPAPWYHARCLF